ncbi:unnamed protein product [Cylicocyclus nassatus]|uniref:Fucosyltransferase n=1 Tax=Cylicocyclus nassatus TaxID=53992 RepID=A0AA36HAU0_CYLNA|nr:unnamed protein product [Cylicocyclus nassatus]
MGKYSIFIARWIWLLACCVSFYCLVQYVSRHDNSEGLTRVERALPPWLPYGSNDVRNKTVEEDYEFNPSQHNRSAFFATEVLTSCPINLKKRMKCNADAKAPPKLILSWNVGATQENLGGCPDWNCELTHDMKKLKEADAVLFYEGVDINRTSNQYFIYFSQESPKNSRANIPYDSFYNMSLGFRHDSPTSSPYGYTVKLSARSRLSKEVVDMTRVNKKSKGAAWFVSHCYTNSKREKYVEQLQKHFPVDIYGGCSQLKCARGGKCENALDDEYHFYIAFENSICKDYVTEKLWNQGYRRDVVPIVLKRSLVEKIVPPHSFIAADDFNTTKDLANYLRYLMQNKSAYTEYFNWRRDYKVVFLDGNAHDSLERPWGFCQICRLIWENPRPHYSIPNFKKYWDWSCEKDGELVDRILENEIGSSGKHLVLSAGKSTAQSSSK